MTSSEMLARVEELCERYQFVQRTALARSMLGREIPLLRVGVGERSVLYVGAHHGTEWLTSAILFDFFDEICDAYQNKRRVLGLSLDFLLKSRTLLFVPMLNPDGVDISIEGAMAAGVLGERVTRINGNSSDFGHWQANARGVDLNHNYSYRFDDYKRIECDAGILGGAPTKYSGDSPESEPESAALADLVRALYPHAIYSFHSQGEEIYCGGEHADEKTLSIARTLAAISGYRLCIPKGSAGYGGLSDWAVNEMGISSFTVEIGRGQNPLPIQDETLIYATLRRMLFYSAIL